MASCTYVYFDPKDHTPRYVGKGASVGRARSHLRRSTNPQLGTMIKKRIADGFAVLPTIIEAECLADAAEMEMLLIALIGREDLQTGSLFNKTDGGDGGIGRIHSAEECARRNASLRAMTPAEREVAHNRLRETRALKDESEKLAEYSRRSMSRKAVHAARSQEAKASSANKVREKCSMACTTDGVTIYPSLTALVQALGQGKNGRRSPTFRYVEQETN